MPSTSATATEQPFETVADLMEGLGNIAPRRVLLQPPLGTATEEDLLRLHAGTDRLFELVDGTLVEKVMGWVESALALRIGRLLGNFLEEHDLGELTGADGGTRLMPGLVRLPDVSFFSWDRLPNRQLPTDPIPNLVPDLAIEVLSEGNTPGEMNRKLKDYFFCGVRLVWLVDPRRHSVEVFTAVDQSTLYHENQTLDGGEILPGLALSVRAIFARMPALSQEKPPQKPKSRRKPKSGEQSS